MRQDGLTYRLVPVANGEVNKDWVVDKLMNKFKFGNVDKPGVYFDEENRRHLNSIRLAYAQSAISLALANRKDEAKKLLNKCDQMMLESNFPYGMVSRYQQHNQFALQFLQAAYIAGETALAKKVSAALLTDIEQQASYYQNLSDVKRAALEDEEKRNDYFMKNLLGMQQEYLKTTATPNLENTPAISTKPGVRSDSQ